MKKYAGILTAILFCISAHAAEFPNPAGFINDFAGVITPQYERALDVLSREVEQKTGAEIVVVTMNSLEGEEFTSYANRLFETWRIGKKDRDNGLLFLAVIRERNVRIEVGYGLEGVLPDAVCGRIRDRFLVPAFKKGEYGKGFLLGVRAAAERIARESGVRITGDGGQAPPAADQRSGGGSGGPLGLLGKIIIGVVFLYLFIRHPRLFILMMLFSGGGRSRGGGGGFGGGFGGFGGGSSGGGGAGGSW